MTRIKSKFLIFTIIGIIFLHPSISSAEANQPLLQPDARVILEKSVYDIHADQTYTVTVTSQRQLLTKEGINDNNQYYISYFPDSQKIDWIKATIAQPSGKTVEIPKENIHIQPTFANVSAASLSNQQLVTITFPQLTSGSKIIVKYQLTETQPSPLSFNIADQPAFYYPTIKRICILNFPKSLPLTISQRGGYTIKRTQLKDNINVVAELNDQAQQHQQANMVAYEDVLPLFSASSLQSWQQIGNQYWQRAKNKVIVNEEINTLAQRIAGDRKGLDAAKAIYNWTINNIYYISINLNKSDTLIPKSSIETLKNRYGDCKAITTLLQALYAAIGIKSQPALIGWNNSYEPFPTVNLQQFNHVILYLPDYNLFINSTDRYAPFGVLEEGLENKRVVVASSKSLVTQTPKGNPQANIYQANQYTKVEDNGTITGKNHSEANGLTGTKIRSQYASLLKQYTTQNIINENLKNTIYGGFGKLFISELENVDQPVTMVAMWHSPQAINIEKNLFLVPTQGPQPVSINSIRNFVYENNIQYPIVIQPASYYWHDIVAVPSDYHIKLLPHNIKLSNNAGDYISQYKALSPSKIEIIRTLILKENHYTANNYKDLNIIATQAVRDINNILYFVQDKKTTS